MKQVLAFTSSPKCWHGLGLYPNVWGSVCVRKYHNTLSFIISLWTVIWLWRLMNVHSESNTAPLKILGFAAGRIWTRTCKVEATAVLPLWGTSMSARSRRAQPWQMDLVPLAVACWKTKTTSKLFPLNQNAAAFIPSLKHSLFADLFSAFPQPLTLLCRS